MRYSITKKPLLKRIIALLLLALAIFMLMLLADHPALVEKYYSRGFYIFICRIWHPVLSLLPFSVGDLLYIAVVGYLIYKVVMLFRLLFKRQFKQAGMVLLGLVIGVQAGILAFYLFWGMNYFRPSAAHLLNLQDFSFTTADLKAVTRLL